MIENNPVNGVYFETNHDQDHLYDNIGGHSETPLGPPASNVPEDPPWPADTNPPAAPYVPPAPDPDVSDWTNH